MPKQATVFSPTTGERKVVTVGDPNAFAGGFVLETPTDNFTVRSQGKSLVGSAPEERTLGPASEPEGRSLPEAGSSTENFKSALRQVSLLARSETRPTLDAELSRYQQAGVPITAPSAISSALEAGTLGRREVEKTVFEGALDLIKKSEDERAQRQKTDLEFASNMMKTLTEKPELFASLTGADFEELKSGKVSDELLKKIGEAAKSSPSAEKTQVVEVGGRRVLIDSNTGVTIKDLGTATSADRPITLSPGATLVDPTTGEVIAQTPTAPKYEKIGETLYRVEEGKNPVAIVTPGGSGARELSDAQQTKVSASRETKAIESGVRLKQLLDKYRFAVEKYGFETFGQGKATLDGAYAELKIAYKEAANLGALTGPDVSILEEAIKPSANLLNYRTYLLSGGQKGVLASIDQVSSNTEQNLDTNRQRLLAQWGDYADDPYIQQLLGVDKVGKPKPVNDEEFRQLKEEFPELTDEEIKSLGFSGDKNIRNVAEAIGQFESGGDYQALGPVTRKGDRAYGKYQVMGANIPSWTKETFGVALTPEQFLAFPKIQDEVAERKMGNMLAQYGNVRDVASVWFSGRPLAKAGNASDILGTTVPQYVSAVESIFNKLS